MPKPQDIHLSIVIPAFNEADRIESTLDRITAYLDQQPYKSEVLVIVDGSTDQTISRVSRAALWRQYIQPLDNRVNRGKGSSVRHGMLSANGQYLLMCDADLPTPMREVERLMQAIEAGHDVAIASRALKDSDVVVRQPWWRESTWRAFNKIAQTFALPGIQDSQCGFKLFTRDAALAIFPMQRIEQFAFDVEVLWIARKLGLRITEVPTAWANHPPSKVRLVADFTRMLFDLVRIRLLDWRGAYTPTDATE